MLENKNPGTVTPLETDEIGHLCKVLCVDGSYLKHKCKGHMLVANDQLYPVYFSMVDSKNNNS